MATLVTVGVCVRNSEHSVAEAIRTILKQDFPHEQMELIVVDDGSEDNTLRVVRDLVSKTDICTKISNTEWRGLGYSRNTIVKEASGEYLVWVDGDMSLPSDHVSKQIEFMRNNPQAGIAKARYDIYPGENLIATLENAAFIAVDYRFGGKPTTRTLGTGGSIYRVEAIRRVNGFDSDISGTGEDMDAEYRVRKAGWSLYLGTPARFYERRRRTWQEIWKEGVWHGYGVHNIIRKNTDILALLKMTPMAGFVAGAWYSTLAFRAIHRKAVFLLPIQYSFKRVAWCVGFLKGQIKGNKQHPSNNVSMK